MDEMDTKKPVTAAAGEAQADGFPAGGARSGRGLRVALAVSVALNLLVLGVVAGAVLRDGGPRGRMMGDLEFGPFTEALSREDRAALRDAFVAKMPAMRDMRRQMRNDLAGILRTLRAEPFDPAALRAVMEAQSARLGERLQMGQDLLLERLQALSPVERAQFADRLEDRLRHGDGGGPEGGPDGGRGGGGND